MFRTTVQVRQQHCCTGAMCHGQTGHESQAVVLSELGSASQYDGTAVLYNHHPAIPVSDRQLTSSQTTELNPRTQSGSGIVNSNTTSAGIPLDATRAWLLLCMIVSVG